MMAITQAGLPHGRDNTELSPEEMRWLHELETVTQTRVLVPMRTTEKLGKLGLIELRASRLALTERGRQFLNRSVSAEQASLVR